MRKYHFLIAVGVIMLDRVTKWLVATRVDLHDSISILPGFVRLTHVQNSGAAFGLFADSTSEWKTSILIMFSTIALIVVSALLWKNSHSITVTGVGLSLILGGAVGNLWDRLLYGRVVDFLDFYISQYHWPAFNIADSAIVIGALLLVAEILLARSPAEQNASR
ncbi:MAG TPA: signal peptidase II [Terriglobales bacterium]|jgi:signal peptidase II|nr:signal peptidase II [Terriglobales bacterium]